MKSKIILLALLSVVLVKSVPFDQTKSVQLPPHVNFYQNKTKNSQMKQFMWKVKDNFEKPKLLADDDLSYRLPNDSIPIRYDLWLKTDVDKGNFDFSGRVKIHVKVITPSRQITLHHRELEIDNIDLLNIDGTLEESNLAFDYDNKVEFLNVFLSRMTTTDELFILDISYHGTLRSDGGGFYRASYQKNDVFGDNVWYATTQFEPTDARHALPCFDEPGLRAVIGLEIQHDKNYSAISNMPIVSRDPIEGTDYVTSKFEDTPKMQTYLLAFIISDFDYVSNNEVEVPQRIFAKPQSIAKGDGDFAATVVGPILKKLEDHFGVNYPLPKMDHAAITDFIFGAMENFGLITYREGNLLYNPQTNRNDVVMKNVIELIAHEYTHQYFGNIVGPKWWTYTWLNEGFATLYECYIPSLIYPENDHMSRFRDFHVSFAFLTDKEEYNSVPLNHYVESPQGILAKFNQISYQKGGAVLRMFQEALGVSTFTKGLAYYLNEMYYQSATPDDLHRNLQKAFDEDNPRTSVNIDQIMRTWEDQSGYPIVHVERSGSKFKLTQKRVGGGSEIYSIPLSYTTNSLKGFETKTPKVWMNNETIEIDALSERWLVPNIQQTGYYKVSYDKNIWMELAASLKSDHETFPAIHRGQLFQDILNPIEDATLEAINGLDLMSSLNQEKTFSVWEKAFDVENFFSEKLFGTTALRKYREFVQRLTQPHIDRLGVTLVKGEPENDSSLRTAALDLSCKAFDIKCLTYQSNLLRAYVESGEGSFKMCDGLRLADETVFTFIAQTALNDPETRYDYLFDLGCSLDQDLLKSFLEMSLDETNDFEGYERQEIIEKTASKSVGALEVVLKFVFDNFNEIEEVMPNSFGLILLTIAKSINSQQHEVMFQNILNLVLAADFLTEEDSVTIISVVDGNLKWLEKNLHEIEMYFDGESPTDSTPTETSLTPSTTVTSVTLTTTPKSETSEQPTSTESTTLGASALITSFTAFVLCAVVRLIT